MKNDLKRQINLLKTIILLLILVILIVIIIFLKLYNSKECKRDIQNESLKIEKKEIDKTLDNYPYIGIYSYSEGEKSACSYATTLVLTSDYNAIFYVGDCNNKAYYYGKYRIDEHKIYLYSLVLEDSSSETELTVDDDEIYFNLTDDTQIITSIYGRSESIRLEKNFNAV